MYSQLRNQLSIANAKIRKYRAQAQSMDKAHKRLKKGYTRTCQENTELYKALRACWDAIDVESAVKLAESNPERYGMLGNIPYLLGRHQKDEHDGSEEEVFEEEVFEEEDDIG